MDNNQSEEINFVRMPIKTALRYPGDFSFEIFINIQVVMNMTEMSDPDIRLRFHF